MLEKLLKRCPAGSDITIMNSMYQNRVFNPDTGNYQDDFMVIVYKNNETGQKDHIIIDKPKYKFYKLKEGVRCDYARLFIEKEKVEEIEVPYTQLEKTIAKLLNREAEYNDAKEMKDNSAIRKFHADPRIMNSDQSIEDHYRFEFSKFYKNNICRITKGYYDIEVDSKYLVTSDFPEPEKAECPVNAITFYAEQQDRSFTFLLKDSHNPLIEKFENEYKSGKFTPNDISKFVQDAIGGYKKMIRNKLDRTDFRLYWFDNEITLLKAFFNTVYRMDPDFMIGWNSSGFDLNYIIHRIVVLGEDPVEICCDPRWEKKFLKHYIDQKNINDFAERGDFTRIASNTVWLDQMIQFCSRRKSKMGSFTSFKLDDIANLTAGVRKLDYHHITSNLTELPYLDYKTFVLYNIIDVVNQKCIENKAQDLEYLFAKCIKNCTTYAKGHRQTVYLINRMTSEWDKIGLVIGNNINKWNVKPEKYQGALVEDPRTVSSSPKINIFGVPILLCDNADDFDFKSLYPSIMIEFNIAPNTQIGQAVIWNKWVVKYEGHILYAKDNGVAYEFPTTEIDNEKVPKKIKLFIDEECTQPAYINPDGSPADIEYIPEKFETIEYKKFYENENIYHNPKYSRSGEFMENLVCDNIVEFCKRWFGLAGVKELLEDMQQYMQQFMKFYGTGNPYFGFYNYQFDTGKLVECPARDMVDVKAEKVLISLDEDSKVTFDFKNSERCGVDKEYAKSRINGIHLKDN